VRLALAALALFGLDLVLIKHVATAAAGCRE